jgi:TolB-like protein/thioredoxin-like negative regulator of GroEL
VTREQLEKDVWQGTVVGYDSLSNTITKLRKAFNDDPHQPQIIETIPKVGYRLVAKVTDSPPATDLPADVEHAAPAAPEFAPTKQGQTPRSVVGAAVALVAVATTVAIVVWFKPWGPREPVLSDRVLPLSDKPSIAVLPFDNLSRDPEQEYFSDGISDDLITELSKVSGLLVIARNSSFAYKGKSTDIRDVARELGVRYVLEGSVRKAAGRIRINAQLVDGTTGGHLWAERYDESLADVFALQDKVTEKIVAALKVKLTPREKAIGAVRDTSNVAAYDAFLKGWAYLLRKTPEDAAKAIPFFEQALALDPNYSRAYAALAQTYWDYSIDQAFNNLVGPAMNVSGHSGYTAYLNAWKFLQKARNPPSSQAHTVSARMLQRQHRFDEALEEARQAVALGPSDPAAHDVLIENLIYAGDVEGALRLIDESIRLDPNLPGEKLFLKGMAYYTLGRLEEAVAIIGRARTHNPKQTRYAAIQAAALTELGQVEDAKAALQDYLSGWTTYSALNWAMFYWPFQHLETLERLAKGFIKAGLTAPLKPYYLATRQHRLSGEQIKALLSNKTMVGEDRSYFGVGGDILEVTRGENAQIVRQGYLNYFRDGEKTRIENELLCDPWRDLGDYCVPIYRNPAGARDANDEYLFYTLMSTFSFSVFD